MNSLTLLSEVRKEELAYFLKWINDIKERKSLSTAESKIAPLLVAGSWVG